MTGVKAETLSDAQSNEGCLSSFTGSPYMASGHSH